jgi:hypothetical protein
MTKTKGQKVKQHNGLKNSERRTSNKMAKEKGQNDTQHNDQKKRERMTTNTMAKRKRSEGQATQ